MREARKELESVVLYRVCRGSVSILCMRVVDVLQVRGTGNILDRLSLYEHISGHRSLCLRLVMVGILTLNGHGLLIR